GFLLPLRRFGPFLEGPQHSAAPLLGRKLARPILLAPLRNAELQRVAVQAVDADPGTPVEVQVDGLRLGGWVELELPLLAFAREPHGYFAVREGEPGPLDRLRRERFASRLAGYRRPRAAEPLFIALRRFSLPGLLALLRGERFPCRLL